MKQGKIYFITILILLLSISCSAPDHDQRLEHACELISKSPNEALSALEGIDYGALPEHDRHYYDFLTVKARDKAYIRHTSDSTILRLVDYYSTNENRTLYPEALYYAARTYCDMGDSPTALSFFHKALDNIPADSSFLNLKANILSQTGRLLTHLRLYNQAIPYIESSIKISEIYNDTLNMVYDIQLLGGTYLRDKKYHLAEYYYNKALNLSSSLPMSLRAKSRMYLAAIKYEKGQGDSALNLIRDTPDLVSSNVKNNAFAYASKIYLQKEQLDTAIAFAKALIHSPKSINKETGYQTILSTKLKNVIPIDTLYRYLYDYVELLENYHDNHQMLLALNQQNLYNYQTHEIKRRKAEKENDVLRQWFFAVSFLVLIMTIIILYLKNRSKNYKLKLHHALENIAKLKQVLNDRTKENNDADKTETKIKAKVTDNEVEETTEDLRKKLRKELQDLYNTNRERISFSTVILDSPTYKKLQSMISKGESIKENSELWAELEALVLKVSPNFITNLQLLVGGKLSSYDLHTSLLIKCGFQPTQMTILLNRAKGTIVSRRESLCFRVFEEKLGTKVIDGIIALL